MAAGILWAVAVVAQMTDWAMRAAKTWFQLQLSWQKMAAAAARRETPGAIEVKPGLTHRVAAVQWDVEPVVQLAHWLQRVEAMFQEAVRQQADLIVFPEFMALPLLGLALPDRRAAASWSDERVVRALRQLAPLCYRAWARYMAQFSRLYQRVTVAGSGLIWHRGHFVNRTLIMDRQGRIVAYQDKLHPMPQERAWGIEPGRRLMRPLAEYGGLAAIVCHDASYYEVFRLLADQQAAVVAVPIADPDPHYAEAKARRGTWARVQEVPVFGVVAAATGNLFGISLTGKAGIYAPRAVTEDGSGILAESAQPTGEGMVVATLDYERLAQWRAGMQLPWHILGPKLNLLYRTDALDEEEV
jgi:predicted amidohydrolase